jgi:hypothetical protein
LKSQEEDLPGKTKRIEEDALPESDKTRLTIASKSAIDRVKFNLGASSKVAVEDGALLVLATVVVSALDLGQHRRFSIVSWASTIETIIVVASFKRRVMRNQRVRQPILYDYAESVVSTVESPLEQAQRRPVQGRKRSVM